MDFFAAGEANFFEAGFLTLVLAADFLRQTETRGARDTM
jgi:hypothetical protein